MLKAVTVLFLLASMGAANPAVGLTKTSPQPNAPNSALCNPCVELGGQGMNILFNVIQAGIGGGCDKLCSHLNSTAARDACDLVCGYVGIKAFVKALHNTLTDPIYFCEVLHACAKGPDDAHVDLLSVQLNHPTILEKDVRVGSSGVTLEGLLTINVTKETGVGQFAVGVHGPVQGGNGPIGGKFLLADGLKEGVQRLGIKLNIQDTMDVTWRPGSYMFQFHVCQGECGSKQPHSIDFGLKSSNFTISESQTVVV